MLHPVESDILPIECPGCGKTDRVKIALRVITYWNRSAKYSVVCDRCGWSGPEEKIVNSAVKGWNKRYANIE